MSGTAVWEQASITPFNKNGSFGGRTDNVKNSPGRHRYKEGLPYIILKPFFNEGTEEIPRDRIGEALKALRREHVKRRTNTSEWGWLKYVIRQGYVSGDAQQLFDELFPKANPRLIKERREELSMTLTEFATHIGRTTRVASMYESGGVVVDGDLLDQVSHVLMCHPDVLTQWNDEDVATFHRVHQNKLANPVLVKAARLEAELEISRVSLLVGVTDKTLEHYERFGVSGAKLDRLARLYKKPVSWFYGETPQVQLEVENLDTEEVVEKDIQADYHVHHGWKCPIEEQPSPVDFLTQLSYNATELADKWDKLQTRNEELVRENETLQTELTEMREMLAPFKTLLGKL